MTQPTITFGTRGSALARRQTATAVLALRHYFPDLPVETTVLSTRGDRELSKPLPQIGGKGLFTAELEAALHSGEIDLAVHSLKDLPTDPVPGLTLGAILRREDPGDTLISRNHYTLATLPEGACVGTSSLRRAAQLLAARPDLSIIPIRGNIDTRISKALDENGPYDAIILAAAGLNRLSLDAHSSERLAFETMLPAPGQGAIAIQCRADDARTLDLLTRLNNHPTRLAVTAERAFLAALNAGCSLPVAALGGLDEGELTLEGLVASLDGRQVVRLTNSGPTTEPEQLGRNLAQQALAAGAGAILEALRVEAS
jgi:hydroxymethylbilane synthase